MNESVANASGSSPPLDPQLDQLPRVVRPQPRPPADLAAAAGHVAGEAARQDVPAEVAMVRRLPRQGVGVARQDLVADRRQPLAEELADVGVLLAPADDLCGRVGVDVADGQLVEVGGEAAARLDLALAA